MLAWFTAANRARGLWSDTRAVVGGEERARPAGLTGGAVRRGAAACGVAWCGCHRLAA